MKNKLPAFTIMEVTISMLIAALVIGITYTAYHVISGTYADYTKKQNQLATFMVLDKLIKQDFATRGQLIRSEEGLDVNIEGMVIHYTFNPAYIIRNQFDLETDTFKIDHKSASFTLENQTAATGSKVDQLELKLQLEGEEIPVIYKKTYSSTDLFE